MDKELINIAGKFVASVEKMADTTEKIGNLTDKMMNKFDEEMAKCEKRSSKYFAKSGDQFKLATDITIPTKARNVDPNERVDDEVIKAGTIVTVNITIHHGGLAYQIIYKDPFITVSCYELNELIEGGILEKV